MDSEGRCAASLDVTHCFELFRRQWVAVAVFLAVKPKDVGKFDAVWHPCSSLAQGLMSLHCADRGRGFSQDRPNRKDPWWVL